MKTRHLLFCLVLCNVAYAEVNMGKQIPSVNDVINALSPAANPDNPQADDTGDQGDVKGDVRDRFIDMSTINRPKTKSHRPGKPGGKGGATPLDDFSPKDAVLSMEIMFDYDSAKLTDYAKMQLKPVGEALALGKLASLSYIVEGHTDAIGSNSYNQALSEQRAASVKSFFVNNFGISATQIQSVGRGKNNLLDPKRPTSEVNRRVRIIARK